jgi:hypothetical protein
MDNIRLFQFYNYSDAFENTRQSTSFKSLLSRITIFNCFYPNDLTAVLKQIRCEYSGKTDSGKAHLIIIDSVSALLSSIEKSNLKLSLLQDIKQTIHQLNIPGILVNADVATLKMASAVVFLQVPLEELKRVNILLKSVKDDESDEILSYQNNKVRL